MCKQGLKKMNSFVNSFERLNIIERVILKWSCKRKKEKSYWRRNGANFFSDFGPTSGRDFE